MANGFVFGKGRTPSGGGIDGWEMAKIILPSSQLTTTTEILSSEWYIGSTSIQFPLEIGGRYFERSVDFYLATGVGNIMVVFPLTAATMFGILTSSVGTSFPSIDIASKASTFPMTQAYLFARFVN